MVGPLKDWKRRMMAMSVRLSDGDRIETIPKWFV